MVDCGEGAQLQMRRMKIKFSMLRHIFISHLHGDHMLGLPGLLSTLSLHEIGGQVHVYMLQEGINWLKDFMRIAHHYTTLEVVFHPIERAAAVAYEDECIEVSTFPLFHTIPAIGFIFREKPKPRKLRGDMLAYHQVPVYRRAELKWGADFVKPDGAVVPNAYLTLDPAPPLSYAYCSDTTFSKNVIESVMGVTTIYHEATYADDKMDKARLRGHSTARQAGIVAREAGAHQLILGHFSKSYTDESAHLAQAAEEFAGKIVIADEGMKIPVI